MVVNEQILKSIGDNIRKIRDSKNISQQELADHSNVAKSTIHRIENGKLNPSIITIIKICEHLQIDINQIIH
jgi:DNA-binding XRE family transcriptional regulator